jgi:hypothetical protein
VVAFFAAANPGSDSAASAACHHCGATSHRGSGPVAIRSDLGHDDDPGEVRPALGSAADIELIFSMGPTKVIPLGDEVDSCAGMEACAISGQTLPPSR